MTLQPRRDGGYVLQAYGAHKVSASATIVESIPVGMNLDTKMSTYDAWMWLINSATQSIDMAHYYFELMDVRKQTILIMCKFFRVNTGLRRTVAGWV